ncbi:hypothetical protein FOL46_000997 [Perkinsus olseni]|uniref:Uncharacterized protein n=1 Tax=Perkinsus olseni TaxID=32597 RepID=A0A7J6MG60_PEROL|nr:hypothetical protein FOL46_000997 [Perkinsus olseni]
MAIERLWNGQQGREPMQDLMGDIMEYCKKPALALDCPREQILTDKWLSDDFTFIDRGVVYQVSQDGQTIKIYSIATAANRELQSTEVSTLCSDATEKSAWECYYAAGSRNLYVLYNDGRVLLQHDMATGETEEPISIPHLSWYDDWLSGIIVVGDLLYVAMERWRSLSGIWGGGTYSTDAIEVFFVRLAETDGVRSVCTINKQAIDLSFSFIGFTAVPDCPHGVDVFYKANSTWHSIRVNLLRSDNPMLFSARRDDIIEFQKLGGKSLKNTAGLDQMLVDEDDVYVLRHPKNLRKAVTIDKNGKSLPGNSTIIFGRWSFCYIDRRSAGGRRVIHCHPYLM